MFHKEITTHPIQSPLNYTGGKFKLLKQILPHFPSNINIFIDLFCGGCNVGMNANAKRKIFNDLDINLYNLYNIFKIEDKNFIFKNIENIIEKFSLSQSSKYGYDYYLCKSNDGLQNYNKSAFIKLRNSFNTRKKKDSYYYLMLYVLVVFSFNNQLRFNAKGEFNLPIGKRDFNSKMQVKLSSFIDRIKEDDCEFSCNDFRNIDIKNFDKNTFVYIDPPYLITCATYNEKNAWNEKDEQDLFVYLDNLNAKRIKFALSNVLSNKGKRNEILIEWINKNRYKVIHLNHSYANSNYQTKDRISKPEEILVINY